MEDHIKMAQELDLRGGHKTILEKAEFILEAAEISKQKKSIKIMDDAINIRADSKESFWDKALRQRNAWLLTDPKTLTLPLASAAVRLPAEIAVRGLAAVYSAATKAPRGKKVFFSEVPSMVKGGLEGAYAELASAFHGLLDGFKMVAKEREFSVGLAKRIERIQKAKAYGALTKKALEIKANRPNMENVIQFNELVSKEVNAVEKTYGTWHGKTAKFIAAALTKGSFSVLGGMDNFVKTIAWRMSLRGNAAREGLAKGLEGKDLSDFIEIFINDKQELLRPAIGQARKEAGEAAAKTAKEITFTNKLEGAYASVASTVFDNTAGKLMSPFYKMGLNGMEQGFQHTPILRRFSNIGKDMDSLKRQGGPEWAIAQGRIALGATIGLASFGFVFTGNMIGRGPANPEQRKKWKAAGAHEYALRFGDTFLPFERFGEPFARIMKVGADLGQLAGFALGAHSNDSLRQDFEELTQQWALLAGDMVNPDFFSDSFGQLIDAFENEGRGNPGQAFIDSIALSFLPLSGALRFTRKQFDPLKRETRVAGQDPLSFFEERVNKIANVVPGWSLTLEAQRDMFYEVQHYPPMLGPDLISPVFTTEFTKDPVRLEILRLGAAGPLTNPEPRPGEQHLMLTMPPRRIDRTVAGVSAPMYLDNKQYDRYVQLTAGIDFPGLTQTLHDRLFSVIATDYSMLDASRKTDQNKRRVIAEIVTIYRRAGKAQLIKEMESDFRFQMMEHALNVRQASIVGEDIP